MASFKKRSAPPSATLRRNNADDDGDDDYVDISMIKMGQQLREKTKGTEFTNNAIGCGGDVSKSKASGSSSSSSASSSSSSSSSSTMLGSTAFESRIDTGLSGAPSIAHEKIMQQYIEDSLSKSSASSSSASAPAPTAEDELYRLPDEIKVVGKAAGGAVVSSSSSKAASDGADDASLMVAMSLGIVEVALPAPFRKQNLDATEAARRQVEVQREARYRQKHDGGDDAGTGAAAMTAGAGTAPGYRGVPNTTLATNRFFRPQPQIPTANSNPTTTNGNSGGGDISSGGGNSSGQHRHMFNSDKPGTHKRKTADDRVYEEFKRKTLNAPRGR